MIEKIVKDKIIFQIREGGPRFEMEGKSVVVEID